MCLCEHESLLDAGRDAKNTLTSSLTNLNECTHTHTHGWFSTRVKSDLHSPAAPGHIKLP